MSKQTSVLRDHRLEQLCASLITLPAERTVPAVIPGWHADMQWQKGFMHPHQPSPCSLKALESMKSLKSNATIWSRATVWKDGQKWKGPLMELGVRSSRIPALCLGMPFSVILGDAFTTLQLSFSLQQTGDRAPVYLISGDLNRKYSTIHWTGKSFWVNEFTSLLLSEYLVLLVTAQFCE